MGNYITKFEDDKIYSTFYLKESDEKLKYILDEEIVGMKATSIKVDGQPVIALLFKFAGDNECIYGRLYNKNFSDDEEHLQMLMFQNMIPISFMDKYGEIITTALVENDFKPSIKGHIIKEKNKYKPSYEFNNKDKLEDLWMEA